VDRLAAADTAKAKANAKFKGLHVYNALFNACALFWTLNLAACPTLCSADLTWAYSSLSGPQWYPSSAEHDFAEAARGYTEAIELNPNNAVYYANRAAAHIHLENFGCALADASKAIELDPKYIKVWPIKLFLASAFPA
jgi:tetratricopeptide (TPR) repeat protein